jgi:hypothetical protein
MIGGERLLDRRCGCGHKFVYHLAQAPRYYSPFYTRGCMARRWYAGVCRCVMSRDELTALAQADELEQISVEEPLRP